MATTRRLESRSTEFVAHMSEDNRMSMDVVRDRAPAR